MGILSALIVCSMTLGASLAGGDPEPERSSATVLGFACSECSKADLAGKYPGLKLPGKQYLIVDPVEHDSYGPTRRSVTDSVFGEGDLLLKINSKTVSTLQELKAVLDSLELPCDVKIEYLEVTGGSPPKTKRESVTRLARLPKASPKNSSSARNPRTTPTEPSPNAPQIQQTTPKVSKEYDKFKKKTTVEVEEMQLQGRKYAPPEFEVSFHSIFDGATWSTRPSMSMVVVSHDDAWRFLDTDRTLYLVIDGKDPVEIHEPYYSGDVSKIRTDNFCYEYMSWTIPESLFDDMKRAKKIECKVSIVEFDLPTEAPAALRALYRAISELETKPADAEPSKDSP